MLKTCGSSFDCDGRIVRKNPTPGQIKPLEAAYRNACYDDFQPVRVCSTIMLTLYPYIQSRLA